jgi:predicted GTPase
MTQAQVQGLPARVCAVHAVNSKAVSTPKLWCSLTHTHTETSVHAAIGRAASLLLLHLFSIHAPALCISCIQPSGYRYTIYTYYLIV